MITLIGLIIGIYTFTRLLGIALDKNAHPVVRIIAALAVPATALLTILLIAQSGAAPTPPILR